MTNLKSANIGMNKFCGPAVLSILTGKSTDECAGVISSITGNYKVEGVYLRDLLKAADKLGFTSVPITPARSLYGTIVRLSTGGNGMFVVTVGTHFVCIEVNDGKAYFCDNRTKDPIPAASSARLMQTVIDCTQLIKKPEPKLVYEGIKVYQWPQSNGAIAIDIDRVKEFDNPDYNERTTLGYIRAANKDELNSILEKVK